MPFGCPLQRPEQRVADGISDVEVPVRHQPRVVVRSMQRLEPADQRPAGDRVIRAQVVGHVQELVVQEVPERGRDEQPRHVGRRDPGKEQPHRQRERGDEEGHEQRREQHGAQVARAVEFHGLVGEEAVMLPRVPLVDEPQPALQVVHRAAMAPVLREVGIQESERHREPLQRPHLLELHRRRDQHGTADAEREREVQSAPVTRRHVLATVLLAEGCDGSGRGHLDSPGCRSTPGSIAHRHPAARRGRMTVTCPRGPSPAPATCVR